MRERNWKFPRCLIMFVKDISYDMERTHIMTIVAQNLSALMAEKGTNPFDLAKRAGINQTAIYDIMKGKSQNPRVDTLHKIAVDGLGVPLSVLLAEPGDIIIDREIIEVLGLLPQADRSRILTMARALVPN